MFRGLQPAQWNHLNLFLIKVLTESIIYGIVLTMNNEQIQIEISILKETLVDCVLTIAEKVEIRNEISELQARLQDWRRKGETYKHEQRRQL